MTPIADMFDQEIFEAIQAKEITLQQFQSWIISTTEDVYTQGYADGDRDGYDTGYDSGYSQGYGDAEMPRIKLDI